MSGYYWASGLKRLSRCGFWSSLELFWPDEFSTGITWVLSRLSITQHAFMADNLILPSMTLLKLPIYSAGWTACVWDTTAAYGSHLILGHLVWELSLHSLQEAKSVWTQSLQIIVHSLSYFKALDCRKGPLQHCSHHKCDRWRQYLTQYCLVSVSHIIFWDSPLGTIYSWLKNVWRIPVFLLCIQRHGLQIEFAVFRVFWAVSTPPWCQS